jgi:hypothetical protein
MPKNRFAEMTMKYLTLSFALALCVALACCGSNGHECNATIECEIGLECLLMPDEGSAECGDHKRCVRPCEDASDCCDDCICFDPCGEGGSCGKIGSPS